MLEELYREIILDHYQHPRNRGRLDGAEIKIEGANPSCGDEISLYARLRDGRIEDVRFEGHGCSISQASASMMTQQMKGKTLPEARALIGDFKGMMRGQAPHEEALGDLIALQGVRKFPVRIKCATLSWVALERGLDDYESAGGAVEGTATTEDNL
ncbi:MAG: SUF system NifU family Fe-S cluster assembly protein [Armatimonadetes bacterium]|nr:SUF system NifU family Fe-S cluster assembly protein [Armatimonadota bacterium]